MLAAGSFPDSEMARRTRDFDWSGTPLGSIDGWPDNLKFAAGVVLGADHPMFLTWGEQRILLYNDACIPMFGARHPSALGRPAGDGWGERTDPDTTGPSPLVVEREGWSEQAWFGFLRSPVPASGGQGVLYTCIDETERVVGQRRLRALRLLAGKSQAGNPQEACARVNTAVLDDLPFALIYLLDEDGRQAQLAGTIGADRGLRAGPPVVEVEDPLRKWPFPRDTVLEGAPGARRAVVVPLTQADQPRPTGFLVAFVNARLRFDDDYQAFLELVAALVTAAIRDREVRLAEDLEGMRRIHELGTRLLASPDLHAALEEVLDAAMAMVGAPMGDVSLYDPQAGTLEIVAHRGLNEDFLRHFSAVGIDSGSACGRAMRNRKRVVVEDVDLDPDFAPHREVASAAGFRAVQSTPLLSRDGKLLGVLSTHFREPHRPSDRELRMLDLYAERASDLLQRLTVEEALRESEARFRVLAEASPALIWLDDPQGHATYMNPRYRDLVGVDPDLLHGTCWRQLLHPDDAPGYLAALGEAQQQRKRLQARVRVRSADGGWRWLESHALPLYADQGEYLGHVGISIDVTDAVEAEQELLQAARRKDEFLATLAHELRNPLAPIRNGLQLLRRVPEPAAERIRDMMERQVDQIVRLVDDLLDVSRITAGKVELRRAPIDLAAIVRSAIETVDPLITGGNHHLVVTLPDKPVILDADSVRLSQVFGNLLGNAAKYTDPGGHIELAARVEGAEVRVTVRDDGIGISAEMLPRIFDLFTRANGAEAVGRGGLGVGLALTRRIVQLHGGRIEAHSEGPGRGSEFVVHLPLPTSETVQTEVPDAGPSLLLTGLDVVVVDDNVAAADSLAMLLGLLGARTRVAYDGRSALAELERAPPQIVLLDLGMPEMDGHEVARRIREHPGWEGIRLVALTGWGQDSDRERSAAEGFSGHLTKPADIDHLAAVLLDIVESKSV